MNRSASIINWNRCRFLTRTAIWIATEMGALAEDIALSIHPHPTLSETEAETAVLFQGTATHLSASHFRDHL